MLHLSPNENVIYTARKHSFIFFTEALFIFILAVLPIVPLALAEQFLPTSFLVGIEPELFFKYLYMLWLIIMWLTLAYVWTDYYLDAWVVTDKRLIDIEQRGLFNRKISSSRLDLIQDITVEVPGLLPTLIDYGDIHMQTAGQQREFVLKGVAKPYSLKDEILKASGSAKTANNP
jgi:uncharacterized membrane protein YdbT with pleckstrin-like domain